MADWYPHSRDGQLHMVKTWNAAFAQNGQAWGIPQQHIAQLVNDAQAAEAVLDKVKGGERTAADVVQCNMVFGDMETEARFIKKHYLLLPPLTPADFPVLLLPLPDETHTPVPPPAGQPSLTITYPSGPGGKCQALSDEGAAFRRRDAALPFYPPEKRGGGL